MSKIFYIKKPVEQAHPELNFIFRIPEIMPFSKQRLLYVKTQKWPQDPLVPEAKCGQQSKQFRLNIFVVKWRSRCDNNYEIPVMKEEGSFKNYAVFSEKNPLETALQN